MSEFLLRNSSYNFYQTHSDLCTVCMPHGILSYLHSSLSPEPQADHLHLPGCPAHQTGLSLEQKHSQSVTRCMLINIHAQKVSDERFNAQQDVDVVMSEGLF